MTLERVDVQTLRVAIVGTGFIGAGWAVVFARAGCEVRLFDPVPEAAERGHELANGILRRQLLIDGQNHGKIRMVETLFDAVTDTDWVQESGPEDAGIKTRILTDIDAIAPDHAILASSTSAIMPSDFMEHVSGRARCLVAHPFNPPYVMPVVELVPSRWTNPAIVKAAHAILTDVGQAPVIVAREVAGFIANRLQAAVISEAISLVARGVAEPEDIDACMIGALGLRWALLGPFETMDSNAPGGFAAYVGRFGDSYQELVQDLRVTDPWPRAALERIENSLRRRRPVEALPELNVWRDTMVARLRLLVAGERRETVVDDLSRQPAPAPS
jgi:L-gulonate 3-dehydrogenase